MSTHFSAWFSTVALKATNKWTERKVHTNTTKFPFSASCSSAHCSKSFPFRCVRSKLIYLFPLARDLLLSHVPECVSMHPAYTQNNLFRCGNKSGESQASKVQQGHQKTRQNYFSFFSSLCHRFAGRKLKGHFFSDGWWQWCWCLSDVAVCSVPCVPVHERRSVVEKLSLELCAATLILDSDCWPSWHLACVKSAYFQQWSIFSANG